MNPTKEQLEAARERLTTGASDTFRDVYFTSFNPDEVSIWEIFAEPPSDAYTARERIAVVQGPYKGAVEYALESDKFFTEGNGGWIEKLGTIVPV